MKQTMKTVQRWMVLSILPLAGLLAGSISAQAERLTSVSPARVSAGGTITVHGSFNTGYIHDRRFHYHLGISPRRGGRLTYLNLTRSTASTLTATVPARVAPGSYSLQVDFQQPGGGISSFQQSNKIPLTITPAITIRPVRKPTLQAGVVSGVSISSITPIMLTRGDRLLIKGRGFGNRQQAGGRKNTILFSSSRGGWVTIPVQSWSDTMIMTRPINQNPSAGGAVRLRFFRNNRNILSRNAFSKFLNPRVLGYVPSKVRPGDMVTVNIRDFPNEYEFARDFGISLMRGNRPLMNIPMRSYITSNIVLKIPQHVEGRGLSIALYRKSDSKVVSNLLPGLTISRAAMAPIRPAFAELAVCKYLTLPFSGGSFMHNGHPLAITAELKNNTKLFTGYRPRVEVVSATQLKTRINSCVLMDEGIKIRFIYPDNSRSNWVSIQQRAYGPR